MNYMTSHHDNSTAKLVRVLRLMHVFFLATIPVGVLITALLPVMGFAPVYDAASWYPHVIEASIGFITILILIFGYYWPRISRKFKTINKPEVEVAGDHILRMSLFWAVAVSGLLLGIMIGSSWYIWLPFFLLSGIALILTFPTEERWNRWIQNMQS